jgi:hypothetical protein
MDQDLSGSETNGSQCGNKDGTNQGDELLPVCKKLGGSAIMLGCMDCVNVLGIAIAGGVGLSGIIFDWTLGKWYNTARKRGNDEKGKIQIH